MNELYMRSIFCIAYAVFITFMYTWFFVYWLIWLRAPVTQESLFIFLYVENYCNYYLLCKTVIYRLTFCMKIKSICITIVNVIYYQSLIPE